MNKINFTCFVTAENKYENVKEYLKNSGSHERKLKINNVLCFICQVIFEYFHSVIILKIDFCNSVIGGHFSYTFFYIFNT